MSKPDAEGESLSIPASVRKIVDDRDQLTCRVCGKHLGDRRALHHIIYGGDDRGMGGRRIHNPDEIVTVCWLPGDGDCHQMVHSAKRIWQPILLEVARRRGVTALQIKRWQAMRGQRRFNRPLPTAMRNLHHKPEDLR